MSFQHVLAIETSCDDTSVAIVRHDGEVVACLATNQDLVHKPFGGVVPEIASRNHTLQILPLIEALLKKTSFTWAKIDGVVVTNRPGLIGSLLVGVVTAKTLALIHGKPFVGVNHLEAHLLAPFLRDNEYSPPDNFTYPYLALAISGGHTQLYNVRGLSDYQVLGRTVDDAAGEAFDKFAKHLGLGFPGGVLVDREAKNGKRDAFSLPRTMLSDDNYDFSFSGLKSAGVRLIDSLSPEERVKRKSDLCASFQEAVVDSLMYKLKGAAAKYKFKRVILTGGVSANSRLREVALAWAKQSGIELIIPPLRYCTDNAAMVGYAGVQRLMRGEKHDQKLAPSAASWAEDFK
jgi:N6-L-threonylcarbamoyladenine synthase